MYNYEIYKVLKLFDDEKLSKVNHLLSCSKDFDWKSGNNTFRGEEGTKKNKELSNKFYEKDIYELTLKCINDSEEIAEFTFPKEIQNLIISKTEPEGYYNTHIDFATVGDFSVTVFLSEKDTYTGGELCLWINGKEELIKLDPGYAVIYPTGTPHRVKKVESGVRYAIIFWIKSIFKDPIILETCRELRSIKLTPDQKHMFIKNNEKMEDVINQIEFKLTNSLYRLIRIYGST